MRTVADTKPFCDVAIGEQFRGSLFLETDRAPDLSKPGNIVFVKTGKRTYRAANRPNSIGCRTRSVLMKTWPPE